MGPLLYNAIYPKQKDGAPIGIFFPPEGAPVNPYATGIPKDRRPSQRRKTVPQLESVGRGQTFMIKELGNLTSLKVAPVYPVGFRSQGGQGLVSELRRVCEAARLVGRRLGQDFGYRQ